MSVVLEYPESEISYVQIWNNAAFDNGCDPEDSKNPSDSFYTFSGKENQTPRLVNSPLTLLSPAMVPFRPLNPNSVRTGNVDSTKKVTIKTIPKQGFVEKKAKIDEEIEEIESEISRLTSKLEALRLEKAEQNAKNLEKGGGRRIVEQKQSVKNNEERLNMRRGFSMGPNEIMGISKFYQSVKQEIIPLQTINNRRKSCFWKLTDIEEENLSRGGGGKSCSMLSLSSKSRKSIGKVQGTRQAVTSVGLKKGLKKEDGVLTTIQPKKLFVKDEEKSKKPLKLPGRVIASRYNNSNQMSTVNSVMRKRSLPENDEEESKKLRGTESCRVKKRWEIPTELVIPKRFELDDERRTPQDTSVVSGGLVLPRIRVVRCNNETPRDSGPAKRVAELIRKKSFFRDDEKVEASVCQELSFAEDYEE